MPAGLDGIRRPGGGEMPSQICELIALTITRVESLLASCLAFIVVSPSQVLSRTSRRNLPFYRKTGLKCCWSRIIAQTVRAVLLAMATRTTFVGRLFSNAVIQGTGCFGAPRCQRSTARDP